MVPFQSPSSSKADTPNEMLDAPKRGEPPQGYVPGASRPAKISAAPESTKKMIDTEKMDVTTSSQAEAGTTVREEEEREQESRGARAESRGRFSAMSNAQIMALAQEMLRASKWEPPQGYVPRSQSAKISSAPESRSQVVPFQSSSSSKADTPNEMLDAPKRWEPPQSYVPGVVACRSASSAATGESNHVDAEEQRSMQIVDAIKTPPAVDAIRTPLGRALCLSVALSRIIST